MKKRYVLAVGVLALLCMVGCGKETSDTDVEEPPKTDISDRFQKEETEEETGSIENESSVIPMLSATNVPVPSISLRTENKDDGSYYYEDMTEDGMMLLLNYCYPSTRDAEETLKEYVERTATEQAGYEPKNVSVREEQTWSANLKNPAFRVSLTSGGYEDTRIWQALVTEKDGYTYLYVCDAWADAEEELANDIQVILDGLRFDPRKPSTEYAPVNNEEALASLRKIVTENGDLCAAMWLGNGTDITSFLEERQEDAYQFLRDIPKDHYVEQSDGGTEIYAIIPADPLSTVTVYEWISDESNGFYGEIGEVLYKSETGDPFFLRANPSDVQPSTQVVITDSSGEILEWSPCLSLYDGTMVTPWHSPGVMDLTDYGSEPFFGWWCIWVPDDNDFSMNLNFQRFGNHMSYSYGYGNSELLAAYTGTWDVLEEGPDGIRVKFSMTNVDDSEDVFQGTYRLNRVDETYLEVIYEDGSRIGESPSHLFEWSSY